MIEVASLVYERMEHISFENNLRSGQRVVLREQNFEKKYGMFVVTPVYEHDAVPIL